MSERRSILAAVGLVAVITLLWILVTPPSAGPDEPGHHVRAAALVRGELDGQDVGTRFVGTSFASRGFELPAWIGFPPPYCWQFLQDEPVTCSTDEPLPDEGTEVLGTRAYDYQIWGHLLPGLGTFAPPELAHTAARVFDAALPVVLVGLALVVSARRGRLGAATTVLAVTPMAWFMFAVVNPSGLVIAGGIAFWAASTVRPVDADSLTRWLTAVAWAAMVLPRRDGLVWAALALALGILVTGRGLREWWRALGRGPQVVIVVSTLAVLAWAATSDTNAAQALFVVPLAPVAAALGRRAWRAPWLASTARRVIAAGIAGAVVVLGALFVMSLRRRGFDRAVLQRTIDQTGFDLTEAVGLLGWLDTQIPTSMLYLWMVALGALVGVALVIGDVLRVVGVTGIVLVAILTSWTLTMLQNEATGTYWQGRYYLPLLVGVPIVLGRIDVDPAVARRVGRVVSGVALLVLNAAMIYGVRRWAVGFGGTMFPWEWDTYGTVLPPVVLIGLHAVASVALWRWADRQLGGVPVDSAREAGRRRLGSPRPTA